MKKVKTKTHLFDIDELSNHPIFDNLENQSVLITGATGLIGSELVFSILEANKKRNLNIKPIALVRNEYKAKDLFEDEIDLIIQDINQPVNYEGKVDYIIHLASITASFDMASKPVDTLSTLVLGTKNILDFAILKKVKSFLFVSSTEIYGSNKKDIKESGYGLIDPLNPRSSYPIGKKASENLTISYSKQFNLNTKIARLTQTFGAGIDKEDNRLFAYLSNCIVNNEDIILKTKGKSFRNYCYLTDSITALLTILLKGENKAAYNVANSKSGISVKDLAKRLAKTYKTNLKFEIDNIDRGWLNQFRLNLNTKKLEALGWKPTVDLDEMFKRTIDHLRELG